jgi:hypothetical protein
MKTIPRPITTILIAAFLCLAPTGCKPKFVGTNIVTSTVAGREIRAVVEGNVSIHPDPAGTIVSIPGHKLTVQPARVLLDDAEFAKIPATATKVEMTVSAGQLTLTADGAMIATRQIEK